MTLVLSVCSPGLHIRTFFIDDFSLAKEFDFTARALPEDDLPPRPSHAHDRAPQSFPLEPHLSGSPFESFPPIASHNQQSHVRTLAEIEAEQKAAAQLARMSLGSNHGSPQVSSSLAVQHEQSREFPHSPLQHPAPINGNVERELFLRAHRQHEEQQQQEFLARQYQLRQEEMLHEQQLQEMEYHQQRQRQLEIQQQQHIQFQQQQQQQRLLQQQLLSAQTGIPRPPGGHPLLDQLSMIEASGTALTPEQREALMNEAMNKILEAERMEERRRRRHAKIAKMVRTHFRHPLTRIYSQYPSVIVQI